MDGEGLSLYVRKVLGDTVAVEVPLCATVDEVREKLETDDLKKESIDLFYGGVKLCPDDALADIGVVPGDIVDMVIVTPSHLVISSSDWTAKVMREDDYEVVTVLKGHGGPVRSVAALLQGRHVFTGSLDCTIRQWDIETGESQRILSGHTRAVTALAISVQHRKVYSASSDSTVREWCLRSGTCIHKFTPGYPVKAIALSPDGETLVFGGAARMETWSNREELGRRDEHCNALTFSTSDSCIFVAYKKVKQMRLDRLSNGQISMVDTKLHVGTGAECTCLRMSTDGVLLLAAFENKEALVYDPAELVLLHQLRGHGELVKAITSSTGHVYTASWDNSIRVWDRNTGELVRCHLGDVNDVIIV